MHGIRTRYLHNKLVEAGIPCAEPQGAFYVFPSFKKWKEPLAARGVYTCEDLAMYFLENYELATLPGSAFACRFQELCLRLSSSYVDAGTDEKARALVETFKEDPDPERFIENHHPRLREATSRIAQFVADLERS
jgi:aspartate/methionine/tyrosine aminotransferase